MSDNDDDFFLDEVEEDDDLGDYEKVGLDEEIKQSFVKLTGKDDVSDLRASMERMSENLAGLARQNQDLQQALLAAQSGNRPITRPEDMPFDEAGRYNVPGGPKTIILDPRKRPVEPAVAKKFAKVALEANTCYLANRGLIDKLAYQRTSGVNNPQVLAVLLYLVGKGVLKPEEQ